MNNPEHLKIFKEQIRSHAFVIPLQFDSGKAFEIFYHRLQLKKRRRRRTQHFISFAASLAVLIALGLLFQNSEVLTRNNTSLSQKDASESIKQIQITLPDGSTQVIDKKSTSNIETEVGELIARKSGGVLDFGSPEIFAKDTSVTQIDIPYGEKLKIKLSDGTLVWLNSGTSFRFPKHFGSKSKTRTVEVIGEAYFEVTKHKQQPFIVKTTSLSVKVLGTHFNVSSYANDSRTEATLMEGEVQVYTPENDKNPLNLRPNEQAVFQKSNQYLEKNKVIASDFNSWIDNILIVDGMSFLELKNKLERRYNVSITNTVNTLWDNKYKGEFKDESLRETLETIALSSHVEYEIQGKHVTIFKPKKASHQ